MDDERITKTVKLLMQLSFIMTKSHLSLWEAHHHLKEFVLENSPHLPAPERRDLVARSESQREILEHYSSRAESLLRDLERLLPELKEGNEESD